MSDERRDAGEYYPGGKVIPKVPEVPIAGGGGGDVTLGGDQYVKGNVVDGVQRYKKMVISYDRDMRDWGLSFVGEFILIGDKMVQL
jgi:hypothetical protein